MTSRTSPTLAVACALGAGVLAAWGTIHAYGQRRATPPPVRCVSCLRTTPTFGADCGQTAALATKGADLVGTKLPALTFDRWINTAGAAEPNTGAAVTLYRWWTDGCPHCEKTLPAVEALRKKYGPHGLRVVAVYHPKPVREVSDEAVAAAARKMGYEGVIAVDADWSELTKFYLDTGPRPATSASFLVDAERTIRLVHPGPRFYPSDDPGEAREHADYRRIEAMIRGLTEAHP
jgi:thiol-disulfide isomerase/thioredoxin